MADVSKIILPSGAEYNIKDAQARQDISTLQSGTVWLGITTTALAEGSTTTSIEINGETVTVTKAGSMVAYGNKEFIWNDTSWQEFGDLSGLGTLAYQNSASGSYTPAGSVNTSPTTANINGMATVGTLPTFTVSGETLTVTAGTLPTKASTVAAVTGVTASFTGTAATINVS